MGFPRKLEKPTAALGGTTLGWAVLMVVLRAIEHYEKLEVLMKLQDFLGPAASASVTIICVALGFSLIIISDRQELRRSHEKPIILHSGRPQPTFQWKRLKIAALATVATVVLGLVVVTVLWWVLPRAIGLPTAKTDVVTGQIKEAVAAAFQSRGVPLPDRPEAKPTLHQSRPKALGGTGAITVQPGAVASFGQQGGITAGQVNVNAPPMVLASPQLQRQTGDPRMPWSTIFSIKATGLVATGDLRLKCTGPVIKAGISRINPASLVTGSNGPDPTDSTVVVYQLGPELLPGGQEVTIEVYSKHPVTVLSGTIGKQEIRFPE